MSWTLQGNVKYIHAFGTMKTCEILTLLALDTMTTYKTLTHFISWTLRRHVKYLQYSCLGYHVDTYIFHDLDTMKTYEILTLFMSIPLV